MTPPVPSATAPAGGRSGPGGRAVGLVVGLLLCLGAVVAEKAGLAPALASQGSDEAADRSTEDVPFTEPDRLQTALDAAVAQAGSSRATQVSVDDGEVSVVLFDPTSQVWTRYHEYAFDSPGDGDSDTLASAPPPEAEFALDGVTGAVLTDLLTTGNRALRQDAEDVDFLQLVVERPFPAYGDVLVTVSERYSPSSSRVWLSLEGTVLRAEVD